jgi:TonB family protein
MWRRANAVLFFLLAVLFLSQPCAFAQDVSQGARRVLAKVRPTYPELARRANISGTVKLEAVIAPDGKVKFIEVIGGNPILAQAAVEAIRKWKFESTALETRERIELKFGPY